MKWFLIMWFVPVTLLGSWYGLSYHDINFGFIMLSRQVHDLVFEIYGSMMGMPPEDIPPLILKAIVDGPPIPPRLLILLCRRKAKKACPTHPEG